MLNNISNEELLLNNSINQQAKIGGVEKKTATQNPYLKLAQFDDTLEISDQAKKLYEKDKEIEKYKSMVMDILDSPDSPDETETILDSIKTGDYITNDQLAEKMLKGDITLTDSELLSILLSKQQLSESDV